MRRDPVSSRDEIRKTQEGSPLTGKEAVCSAAKGREKQTTAQVKVNL